MRLYLLRRDRRYGDPVYDCVNGLVVRAESEEMARALAAEKSADEGGHVWLDMTKSSCDQLPENGVPGVILVDFNAG